MTKQRRVPGKPGLELKRARKRAGITQRELASTLDVAVMTVSRAENNRQGVSPELYVLWLCTCEDLEGVE